MVHAETFNSAKAKIYARATVSNESSVCRIEFRTVLVLNSNMPFSFIEDQLKDTDSYTKWLQPSQRNNSKARLVTKLAQNSDLVEISLETSSLMFFK